MTKRWAISARSTHVKIVPCRDGCLGREDRRKQSVTRGRIGRGGVEVGQAITVMKYIQNTSQATTLE